MTVQTADFDGLGRRIRKVVTNSGPHDGTVVCYYDGQRIIETRDGSGNMVQQFIHGTQYIDELVMMRRAGHGDLYIQQDANWNVIGATDLNGRLVERYEYTPYGELTADQETGYGDYDGDQDVDDTDRAHIDTGGGCLGGSPPDACRVLDLDFDGDYDSDDLNVFDALDQGYMDHPGRQFSSVNQPFGHQGLLHEPEVRQYQSRVRQYDPALRRFVQRDPLWTWNRSADSLGDGVNLYAYVKQNPVRYADPRGLATCDMYDIKPVAGGDQFSCPISPPTGTFSKFLCCLGVAAYCKGFYCKSCLNCCLDACEDKYYGSGGNTNCAAACNAGFAACGAQSCCSFSSPPY